MKKRKIQCPWALDFLCYGYGTYFCVGLRYWRIGVGLDADREEERERGVWWERLAPGYRRGRVAPEGSRAEGGARCFGCRAGRRVVCAFEVYAFGARAGVVRAYEVYAFGVCAGVVCAGVLSELVLDTEVEELRVVLLYEPVVLGVKSDILILVIKGSFEDGAVALIEVCVVADVVPSGA